MDYIQPEGDSLPLSSQPVRGSSSLNHGLRFMSRDRPHPCHVCGKRFTQKAHLIIHKRTHTGEKPYPCHICHKRFAQSSHLTVHKRVHTGEKPFFCNFCGMGFCRRPRLEAHVLQHMVKEGRELPSSLKGGDSLNGLSMVGPDGVVADSVNQESLDAAAQLMELKMKGGPFSHVKSEPEEQEDSGSAKDGRGERDGSSSKSEIRMGMADSTIAIGRGDDDDDGHIMDVEGQGDSGSDTDVESDLAARGNLSASRSRGEAGALLGLSVDDLDKQSSGLTELTELQKQTLSQSLLINSPKGQQLSSMMAASHHQMMSGHSVMPGSGLTMTGLVRTNSRVSLIDFTAEDIMQHLLSRDDVKSCDFCCVVFKDPAMYYLHRSMHDKMDVRCCNLCGKLLKDKYDFTAHFLNKHT